MRLQQRGQNVHVFLSRRNLKVLLAKLDGDPPNSKCTIEYDTIDGTTLRVTAEEDAKHYANPERDVPMRGVAGPMHPDSERAAR